MARHVLLVDRSAGSPLENAVPVGWRLTRIAEGPLALAWLQRTRTELILVGEHLAGLSAAHFVRSVRLAHDASLIPLVQQGDPDARGRQPAVRAQPDAWAADESAAALAVNEALELGEQRRRDGTRAEATLRLASHHAHLDELTNLLAPWLETCGFAPQSLKQITHAIRELSANAIEWGHGNDPSRAVLLHLRLDDEKVCVLVSDTGPGFDPLHLPHAARPGDPLSHLDVRASLSLREGGFGILLARGLVDHLCYNDAGNEAQLIKYLPARRHPRSPKAAALQS